MNISLFARLTEHDMYPTTLWHLPAELLSLGRLVPQSATAPTGAHLQYELFTKLWAIAIYWNFLKTGNLIRERQSFIVRVDEYGP